MDLPFLCSGRERSLHPHAAFGDPPPRPAAGLCLVKDNQQVREAQFYSMFLFT